MTAICMSLLRDAIPVLWVPAALVILDRGQELGGVRRKVAHAAAWLSAGFFAWQLARLISTNLHNIPEWDFNGFWMWGRMGLAGADFYSPASGPAFAPPGLSEEFTREIVQVGFWYPPPTMLLLAPLGLWTEHTAFAVWYAVNLLALLGTVFLLWRLFAPRSGGLGMLLVLSIVLAMPATLQTFEFGQTNFLTLLAVLLFWRDRDQARGGVWLALGAVVKPYLGFLLLLPLLRARWRQLAMAVGTLAVACTVTGWLFGWQRFVTFLTDNPARRLPPWVHTEMGNQSLSAVLLRRAGPSHASAAHLAFLLGAAGLILVTLFLVRKVHKTGLPIAIGLTLSLVLVIYPFTLSPYAAMLLPVLLFVWAGPERLFEARWPALAFAGGVTALSGASRAFAAHLLAWGLLSLLAAQLAKRERGKGLPPAEDLARV
jgi:hypothetical protein